MPKHGRQAVLAERFAHLLGGLNQENRRRVPVDVVADDVQKRLGRANLRRFHEHDLADVDVRTGIHDPPEVRHATGPPLPRLGGRSFQEHSVRVGPF